MKILIIEDDDQVRELLESALYQYPTIAVNDGEKGIKALENDTEKTIHMVISDIDMPVMNGLDVFNQVKKIREDLVNQFVFCSGNSQHQTTIEKLEEKPPFLMKPFRLLQLQELVKTKMAIAI